MSIHIGAKEGDIVETVLLPGDPKRAKGIAENYLENAFCYTDIRGMLGFTGTYKGKKNICTRNRNGNSFNIYLYNRTYERLWS